MGTNDISNKIRDLRARHGLTLEEVANIVGVGKSTVRKWETGQIANMRRDKIAKLAEALHTTPAYLMGWEELDNPLSPPFSVSRAVFPRLKELRESHGFSPDKVATQLGVSLKEYLRIESGEDTRFLVLVRLADIYRCSTDYLLSYLLEIEGVDPVSELSVTERLLLHKYRSLSSEDQDMVVSLIDKLIRSDLYKKSSEDNSSAMNA